LNGLSRGWNVTGCLALGPGALTAEEAMRRPGAKAASRIDRRAQGRRPRVLRAASSAATLLQELDVRQILQPPGGLLVLDQVAT
jgi:hypothetical protein